MANYNEALLGFLWLNSTLGGDSTLAGYAPGGVWRGLAPPSTPVPFVVMVHQTGMDSTTMQGFRMLTEHTYQVKAIGPASMMAGLMNAASRIDRLLGGPPGFPASGPVIVNAITEGQVLACYREQSFVLDEDVDGEIWSDIGGMYRVLIEQIAT